ncbi:MAG: GIY-YIG nuclease family protein [Candidatus Dadabacteria bacterium]|nr:GIY-YIG nuclease family protein [Candidatus Dadabacteria bacterium]MYC40336.1 GIY-YIG nuclease family protein [Candidatus Dadabacteria bacterium]
MAEAFTIHIYVPDGDPESLMVIDHMNWTGVGLAFPRSKWAEIKQRPEFTRAGVYMLKGYENEDDELPTIYVGQADGVHKRIESHYKDKDFWDHGIVFVSANDGLNRAHITWLEYALLDRAAQANRCHLANGNVPQEPVMTESEKADTKRFLKEILQILPLVGLRVFEFPKPVATPRATTEDILPNLPSHKPDTVIVPAREEGFKKVFLGEDSWHAIRISGGMLGKIKYIAAYQTNPVSAITHYAPVDRIEPYGESGKYRIVFSEKAQEIGPIPFSDAPLGAMQGLRYTTFEKLRTAKKLSDVF